MFFGNRTRTELSLCCIRKNNQKIFVNAIRRNIYRTDIMYDCLIREGSVRYSEIENLNFEQLA